MKKIRKSFDIDASLTVEVELSENDKLTRDDVEDALNEALSNVDELIDSSNIKLEYHVEYIVFDDVVDQLCDEMEIEY